jgi:energy-coupling factor transporter ATP-binding protein EcfA2
MPRPGQVLGLVGTNGIGKSTALKILAGKMKPNLGRFDSPPDWEEILVHFRGSELQNYFTRILEDTMKASIKPQYVDHIPKVIKGKVGEILKNKDDVSFIDRSIHSLMLYRRLNLDRWGWYIPFACVFANKTDCAHFISYHSDRKQKGGTYTIGPLPRRNSSILWTETFGFCRVESCSALLFA